MRTEKLTTETELERLQAEVERLQAELKRQKASLTQSAEQKIEKLEKQATESVTWGRAEVKVLGLLPRLWIEALDKHHRYGALLYGYWARWELSNTEEHFFDWLNEGPGSQIDLPEYPRRLLAESKLIYLTKDQQRLFRVAIQNGRFVWAMDNTPVSVPENIDVPRTEREKEVKRLLESKLDIGRQRDEMLAKALKAVQDARQKHTEPTEERFNEIAKPLIAEGLLCQMRDPYFAERIVADHRVRTGSARRAIMVASDFSDVADASHVSMACCRRRQNEKDGDSSDDEDLQSSASKRARELRMPMPTTFRQDALDWEKFERAIEHDQGKMMEKQLGKVDEKRKGIFVIDKFGILHCGTKQRGVFQHSSFVRGHGVKMAGGITIENGELKHLSPHSGHYQPMLQPFVAMQDEWKNYGVDFRGVKIVDIVKDKLRPP